MADPKPFIQFQEDYSAKNVELIQQLFGEYQAGLGVDLDFQDFERELEKLPGDYSPPQGAILMCHYKGELAGCIALKSHTKDICEMKRLFVRPAFRKLSLGRLLSKELMKIAKNKGYKKMRLDSLPFMKPAQALYFSLGFREVPPYYPNPIEGTLYMEADL